MESQNQITDLEKHLYNKHLIVSRSEKNKPFKIKRDFSDVINTDKHKFLKRISVLFSKHPEINPDTFFRAPYKLYPDVEYFALDFFSTMRAVKAYTTSLRFIGNFCISNGIQFHQYPYHRTSDVFTWMKHYKQNNINIYSVMEFTNIYSNMKTLSEDVQKFFISDFVEQFQNIQSIYNTSTELKKYIKKAIPIISKFVSSQLTF